MREYDVGLHTIYVKLNEHSDKAVAYKYAVPTYIYTKPSNKLSYYKSGYNYFTVTYGGNSYKYDYGCSVYMDYKQKGKKWKKNYGPLSYEAKKKGKLKSNKKYYVRLFYGKKYTYNGDSYFMSGRKLKKMSKKVSFKTGRKIKVKSIKITKAKEWSRPYSYNLIYYIGGYPVVRTITGTSYYTTFKVTVRLKKKPGAKGIYIGNQQVKGNKKKYVKEFTVSGQQKGKKLTVSVYSYQSTKYGGYSNVVRKKAKVRK